MLPHSPLQDKQPRGLMAPFPAAMPLPARPSLGERLRRLGAWRVPAGDRLMAWEPDREGADLQPRQRSSLLTRMCRVGVGLGRAWRREAVRERKKGGRSCGVFPSVRSRVVRNRAVSARLIHGIDAGNASGGFAGHMPWSCSMNPHPRRSSAWPVLPCWGFWGDKERTEEGEAKP